ncbi:hypothetical protein [Cerasicoccus frondis]|uniref:hypothetical protein n=1 Tax=Cerasicoccus frondis TaxID=490090 RepID=UPI0028529823|nr:hypothetical protein [Cerasicoccus frondis]
MKTLFSLWVIFIALDVIAANLEEIEYIPNAQCRFYETGSVELLQREFYIFESSIHVKSSLSFELTPDAEGRFLPMIQRGENIVLLFICRGLLGHSSYVAIEYVDAENAYLIKRVLYLDGEGGYPPDRWYVEYSTPPAWNSVGFHGLLKNSYTLYNHPITASEKTPLKLEIVTNKKWIDRLLNEKSKD